MPNQATYNMKRILEPEIMDTIKEAKAYDDMDFLEVNNHFKTLDDWKNQYLVDRVIDDKFSLDVKQTEANQV